MTERERGGGGRAPYDTHHLRRVWDTQLVLDSPPGVMVCRTIVAPGVYSNRPVMVKY